MAHDIIMPALGMAQQTGLIVSWAKALGDKISVGDTIMEVETDKSIMEVEAAHAGFLGAILFPEGTDVPVGDVVARIVDSAAEVEAAPTPAAKKDSPAAKSPTQAPRHAAPVADRSTPAGTSAGRTKGAGQTGGRILASPKARRLAQEKGIPLEHLRRAPYLSEPFQAADIDTYLSRIPARAEGSDGHLRAIVSRTRINSLAGQMKPDANMPLGACDIVAVLAAHAWRIHVMGADQGDLVVCLSQLQDGVLHEWSVRDPDRMRLSDYKAHTLDTPPEIVDLGIIDSTVDHQPFDAKQRAKARLSISSVSVSNANTTGQNNQVDVEIGFEYDDADVSSATAAVFMNDLVRLIEEPMRRLL